jgi:hypothetical protein
MTSGGALSQVSRGTLLTFIPRGSGLIFNPSRQEIAWNEDLQEAVFRFLSQSSVSGTTVGLVDVYSGPVLIGQVPFSIGIRNQLASSREETGVNVTSTPHQIFNEIFASYSHSDANVVEACARVYKALGIQFYMDKHSLLSGQRWSDVLQDLIDQADIFQLYWSSASCRSSYVENEWKYALSRINLKGDFFIRPLYWEMPIPKIPKELSQIHFGWIDITSFQNK